MQVTGEISGGLAPGETSDASNNRAVAGNRPNARPPREGASIRSLRTPAHLAPIGMMIPAPSVTPSGNPAFGPFGSFRIRERIRTMPMRACPKRRAPRLPPAASRRPPQDRPPAPNLSAPRGQYPANSLCPPPLGRPHSPIGGRALQ